MLIFAANLIVGCSNEEFATDDSELSSGSEAGIISGNSQLPEETQLVGTLAPNFSLAGSDGAMHTLSEHIGQNPVVLAFFPKAFTMGWSLECKSLRDSDKAIRDFDVSFYMISADTIEDNTLFAIKNGAEFPILSNPELNTIRDYGVLVDESYAKRWTFYIDKDGVIAYIDKFVDVRNAGKDITKNLKKLDLQNS